MVWENTLACFSSGGWDAIACTLSNGFLNLAGSQLIAGLMILGLFFYLSFRMKLPWSFTIMATVGFVFILTMKYLDNWIINFALVIAFFIVGFGLYKFFKGRG